MAKVNKREREREREWGKRLEFINLQERMKGNKKSHPLLLFVVDEPDGPEEALRSEER